MVFKKRVLDSLEVFRLVQLKEWSRFKYKMLRRIFFYFDWYFSSVKCFGIIDVVSQNFDRRIATTLSEE